MFGCNDRVRRTRSVARRIPPLGRVDHVGSISCIPGMARLVRVARMVRVLSLATLALLGGACGDPEGLISRSIYTSAAQGPGTRVRLIDLIPFAFERMWIFAPDAPVAAIRDSLGSAAMELDPARLEARGDSTLLIFVRGSRVLFTIPHPPSLGMFDADAVSRSYTPEEAVFIVDSASTPARTMLRRAPAP